jgi:hypothetical protein
VGSLKQFGGEENIEDERKKRKKKQLRAVYKK